MPLTLEGANCVVDIAARFPQARDIQYDAATAMRFAGRAELALSRYESAQSCLQRSVDIAAQCLEDTTDVERFKELVAEVRKELAELPGRN